MSPRKKREPAAFTVAQIEQRFELESFWLGEKKWCPAVYETGRGYGIRVVQSRSTNTVGRQVTYDYFAIDADGLITTAPRGYAKEYKPGRVVDIAAAVERFATPERGRLL